jgi:MFS family permease
VVALWVFSGVGLGTINLMMPVYMANVPNTRRSLAYGLGSTGLMVGQGVSGLGGGLLATSVGSADTVTLFGGLGLLAVGALAIRWPDVKIPPDDRSAAR